MRHSWLKNLRRYLEQEVRRILRDHYKLEVDKETPVEYYLDFKSDERLLELRDALDRIDRGKFGVCLSCGGPIEIHILKSSPGVQFCETCLEALQASRSVQVGASFHHAEN
jgi:RNA polymerase-binding transcription factor DksA